MEENEKGIFISEKTLSRSDLTASERILLSYIEKNSDPKTGFFTEKTVDFARKLGASYEGMKTIFYSLKKKEAIEFLTLPRERPRKIRIIDKKSPPLPKTLREKCVDQKTMEQIKKENLDWTFSLFGWKFEGNLDDNPNICILVKENIYVLLSEHSIQIDFYSDDFRTSFKKTLDDKNFKRDVLGFFACHGVNIK